ncbi:actin cytoskeleton-regulatory complex protein pan1 isoform X3 [Anopheles merus]|uniref:actin cytoskeleton-regulatory complex protein pan1 isoform X3 n=1 Tax=Anopheles merus TaxID=30066 RepID=UPI001BE42E16|nr:actin cytoskeleton-regulatory complex protein pan1 isoform X3 [Anopheles merus]
MKTGYGLNTADSLGYLGYSSKPYSSLGYLGSKGYSSTATGVRSKSAFDKDVITPKVKKPKLRKTSTEKVETPLYKKKTFDFTDYAYREAVNRLKFLLTEAYEPTKAPTTFYYRSVDDGKSEVSDSQSVIERPSITEVSKYFPSTAVSRYGGGPVSRRYSFLNKDLSVGQVGALKPALSNSSLHPAPSVHAAQSLEVAQPPPELLGFIEKQESYIEQLERESQYCREELSTLLKKVKEVVSENEALNDRSRSKALYQLDSSESEDVDYAERGKGKGHLSGPSIVFESRISELEAQLAQSQIDLKKLFNENEENKRKLLHGASDVGNADAYRKQVENLQRDKQNLEETVRKLQLSIDQLKDSEACNFSKSQRSRDMIEQVAFERNQAEIEIRRLKDELERQHERVREVQHEMAKRIADERASAERRYTYHVDQLGGDLSSQWEHATKLQLEVERMKRIESDYKRELNQKSSQIDELKMELKNKSAIFMSDLNQASAEKQSLEQEITSLRLQLERAERQSKVEVSRLNAEITSLRQRLDRADADLLHSKRENLKLADDVASLEKELTLGELNRETRPSKELAKIISDMEAKHTVNSGSRPGSTAARYPAANDRTLPADTYDDASTAGTAGRAYGNSGGKSSRPESRTSDRQYGASQPKQPPELSRNNSVADYVDPRRSESRLSRSSVTNEDAVRSGTVSKEPEYGRAVEPERLSRTSDTTKPDSTGAGGGGASGSSGRLSRESVADQRASRQSMQSLAGSQQYGTADGADTAPSQQYAAQGQYGEFAYPAGGEQYAPLDDQSAAGYDAAQQQYTDQQQYEGYAEQYDQQQAYDQQQYQGYQQPYDAQQYAPEQVYDESSYATGTGTVQQQPVAPAPAAVAPATAPAPAVIPSQSPTQVSAPTAASAPSAPSVPAPASATGSGKQQSGKSAVTVEQKEGNRAVGNTRSGASSRAGANGQRYKQPSGAGR